MQQLMKTAQSIFAGLLLVGSAAVEASAQLAITEVMAQGSCITPDYWELTNYGTEAIDLRNYWFTDNNGTKPLTLNPFIGLVIQGRKSVVFMRSRTSDPLRTTSDFTNWWGAENLPATLQEVRLYDVPGLNGSVGDTVWLYDGFGNVVDTASFGRSTSGTSFVPNASTGIFGEFSSLGVGGTVQSATCLNDIGSPGSSPPEIAVTFLTHPSDQDVDVSSDITFSVLAAGLPRPRYQWTHNGAELLGETNATLKLFAVQASHAGAYAVTASNAFSRATSHAANLSVNTACACARLTGRPVDTSIFFAQTAFFSARARGYPAPRYQWSANGAEIPGATNGTLVVEMVTLTMSGTVYTVQVWNEPTEQCPTTCARTNASAVLTVGRRPVLEITEVMSWPRTNTSFLHEDWFEVTNFDTNEVNLQGYRFADSDQYQAFTNAFTITNSLVLRHGESVIFVSDMKPEDFRAWWGPAWLPPDLKIYPFAGFSLDQDNGETLHLWNAGARESVDAVATAGFIASRPGVSMEFSHYCDDFGCGAVLPFDSVVGRSLAFVAADGGDIGSPGYAARPRVLGISKAGPNVSVRCLAEPGSKYRLLATDNLSSTNWTPTADVPANNNWEITILDTVNAAIDQRFYRLEKLP